jgi:MFS family permease
MDTKISKKTWSAIVVFGLFGQIAWAVENMYFNVFLYNEIGGTTDHIALMVAASAIVATVATLLTGAYSDKINRRKVFISGGYILWGISTLVFAFISRANTAALFPSMQAQKVLLLTVGAVVIMDCVMTFFGSSANDAAFNAWITDITVPKNRAGVEGVLSAMPLLAMLVVSGGFGMIIESVGYPMFFIILGSTVSLSGLLGLLLIKESRSGIRSEEKYYKNIFYGFRPRVIAENKFLYIALISMSAFGISSQVFLPYLIVYLEKYLQFSVMEYSIVLAVAVLGAAIFGILIGRLIDKKGKSKFVFISAFVYIIGLVLMFFARSLYLLIAIGIVMMGGFVMLEIVLNSVIRDKTPKDKAGMFQGIRMIFFVLLPMVIGPYIGNGVINQSNQTYLNEFGEIVKIPVPDIFLAAAKVALFMLIPLFILVLNIRKAENEEVK